MPPNQPPGAYLSYAIVFVSDMSRSVEFYQKTLGLPVRFVSDSWSEFETGAVCLALHASQTTTVTPGSAEAPGTCRFGIRVGDLDGFHDLMAQHGVPCVRPPAMVFGARLAQYADPDGLVISVGESRTAETTVQSSPDPV